MPTDHNIRQLIINKMTDAQYAQAVKSADELYLTPDTGSGGGGTDLPDQTGQSGKFLTTNGSTLSWGTVPAGTVTSVRVQATSPVQSSTSTAQSVTLNTTISLANGYGDTKNPYGTKTANYVLAGPSSGSAAAPTFRALTKADIPLVSEIATSGGTTTSLVTTGEKYIWDNKQDAGDYIEESDLEEIDINNLVPDQSGNSGKFLTTNGSTVSWASTSTTSVKTLNTTNTTAQTTSSSEAIAGSGTINLHKVSKTGSYDDLNNKPTIPQGTVTSVRVQAGTGLASSTSTAQSTTLNTTISIASGYKLPTTTEWGNKQDALPSQSGQSGKFLTTNGSTISWATIQGGSDIDNSTITKNTNNELQTVGIKDVRTDNTIKTWTGTKTQHDALYSTSWVYITTITSRSWRSMAYGNGKFVALGFTGYITTSTDGITWTTPVLDNSFGINNAWYCITYGNGKFFALSRYGFLTTSTDGITWTTVEPDELGDSRDWRAITYGNGKFVALDTAGWVSTSTDGINWTIAVQNSTLGNDKCWQIITYGNNKFVAFDAYGYISTSIDGVTWTTPILNNNFDNYEWIALIYYNNKFIALDTNNYITSSIDGITWETITQDSSLNALGNTFFGLASNGYKLIALSSNGIFASQNTNIEQNTLYNIVNDGLYLGIEKIASNPKFFINIEATNWVADNTYPGYGYKCDISCTGVTPNDYAQVNFGVTEADSGNYATVCATNTNIVTIYGKVNTSIMIPSIIITGV